MQDRKNYDATFCGKLPLHQTNSIQPHGVLLLLDKSLHAVIQVSENSPALLQLPIEEVLTKHTGELFTAESLEKIKAAVKDGLPEKLPLALEFIINNTPQDTFCLLHAVEEGYIIEAALNKYYQEPAKKFAEIYQRIKQVMLTVNKCVTIEEACTIATGKLKQWSGFDKVMIYRFDEHWNGSVIAEAAEAGMETYLGFTFPASDIPKPARDMYVKNPYRLIPNRAYEPVKLYPVLNPATNGFTSLLNADLRSVAAVHLEYLKNMNVMASMSARLLYNEQLWGLIACHHRQPKYLSFEECSIVEMIANVLAQKITALQNAEGVAIRQQLTQQFTLLVKSIVDKTSMTDAFSGNAGILRKFLNAEGVALSWDGQIETDGITPDNGDIETLIYWLRQKARLHTFHLHRLPGMFEESRAFAEKASGILALPIQPDKGNYLVAFRPQLVKTILWGGNPDEAVRFEPNSTAYHPRYSFKLWKETVYNTAKQWHPEEIAAAEQFRNFLVEHTLNRLN